MRIVLAAVAVALSFALPARAFVAITPPPVNEAVINIDFNNAGASPSDDTFVGLGVLSSPGGTDWNGFWSNETTTGALSDEFGNETPVEAIRTGGSDAFPDFGANDLQNHGWGSISWKIIGLQLGQAYETAWYFGNASAIFFGIDHGGAQDSLNLGGGSFFPTFTMPGTNDADYGLMTIIAKDLGNGEVGFALDGQGLDGSVLGLQIKGIIPEPTTLALVALGGVAMLRRRR
jgi:hypothetical protein